jgi:hypothetical protein
MMAAPPKDGMLLMSVWASSGWGIDNRRDFV